MKDRSDDPSHHERTLLPWSYISSVELRTGKRLHDGHQLTCFTESDFIRGVAMDVGSFADVTSKDKITVSKGYLHLQKRDNFFKIENSIKIIGEDHSKFQKR